MYQVYTAIYMQHLKEFYLIHMLMMNTPFVCIFGLFCICEKLIKYVPGF